jgi:glycosyltransferase involved in cell wall biosynthesis
VAKRNATIIIPTWNEATGIRALLPRIRAFDAGEVFAVDGGSTDETVALLGEGGVEVRPQKSRGRGNAIREAVEMARNEAVLIFSPDGNEDPDDVPRLLDLLDAGADLAIASRFLPGSRNEEDDSLLPLRAWANGAFTWIANTLWNRGPYVTDTINGFRAFRRETFRRLGIDAPGFAIEYQTSIRAMKLGLNIREIPTREGNRIGGVSKSSSIPTGLAFLAFLVREARIGTSWSKAR